MTPEIHQKFIQAAALLRRVESCLDNIFHFTGGVGLQKMADQSALAISALAEAQELYGQAVGEEIVHDFQAVEQATINIVNATLAAAIKRPTVVRNEGGDARMDSEID